MHTGLWSLVNCWREGSYEALYKVLMNINESGCQPYGWPRPWWWSVYPRDTPTNHYYVGEAFIPVTSKKLIKLDECDVSSENSLRNVQQQGALREYREHSQNSQMTQQQTGIEKGQVQQNGHNRELHSDLQEDSWNSLRTTPVSRKAETIQKERNVNRGIHSEFIEHSQQSLGTLNIGRSRMQATDQMNTQQIPLTGYENFRQELQTYPVRGIRWRCNRQGWIT